MTPSTQSERLRPAALRPGDTVGVIAPSGIIGPEALEAGCAWLLRRGYKPFYLPSILDRDLYFAGNTARRLDEFHQMFARPEVKAIICARGGYGCNYLLPEIDLELVRSNPKIFCGCSDVTTLLTYLCDAAGLVTFHGPMLNIDVRPDGVDEESWQAAMTSGEAYQKEFGGDEVQTIVPGSAEGMLYGGCLSLLCASLGTSYEVETRGTILFVEDLGEPAFRIDRMLMQLKLAGKFEGVRGVIFGEMLNCGPRDPQDFTLQDVVLARPGRPWHSSGLRTEVRTREPRKYHLAPRRNDKIHRRRNGRSTACGFCNQRTLQGAGLPGMKQKHIHLIGVCGTAMASLAGMLKQRGHRVTGSDVAAYPPMSDFLASLGIPVAQPFSEKNLEPVPDLVIVGNAISRGNVELEYVLDQRLACQSMAQVLHDEFLIGRERLVVAGTHGKTTTSSLLAWTFTEALRAPSFLIGGIPENFGSSFALGDGREFILEGDEYDTAFFDKGPKFLHYFPDAVILTSVEFDHADIYKDLDEVKTAFKRLVNLVPRRGVLIAWDGHPNVDECVSRAFCRVERYGFGERSEWRISDADYSGSRTRWTVWREGKRWAEFESQLAGEYNILNATAAAAMAANYGIPVEVIAKSIRQLPQRQAAARGKGRNSRCDHHRRLCPPPHGNHRDAEGSADALPRKAAVGRA